MYDFFKANRFSHGAIYDRVQVNDEPQHRIEKFDLFLLVKPEQSNDILQSPASFLNDGRSRNDLVIYCSQAKQFFHPPRITVRQADRQAT